MAVYYHSTNYLGRYIAKLQFCDEVGYVRAYQLLAFTLTFSVIRALEIVHANSLLHRGDVDQFRLYRALKYSKLKW